MTKRTIENLAGLNRKFKAQAEKFLIAAQPICDYHGITIEVISGLRSWQQQAALYAQGRTKPGAIVTKARPGSSWHNYGLAIDLGLFANGKYLDSADPKRADRIYKELGTLAATRGIEWAGTWKTFTESPHFQNRFGMTIAEAKAKMETVGFDVQKIV
jgi:peptidoglycan L-alanyl-D-glutamate endopeptidase CwlK